MTIHTAVKHKGDAGLRRGEHPYLFSYDITCPRRSYRVLKILRRWRVDGQLSVHQTLLRGPEVRDLAVELLEEVSRKEDNLFVGRLKVRGNSPVFSLFGHGAGTPLFGPYRARPIPKRPFDGCYLIAYDVRDKRRLQRVQRLVAKQTLFLQRSVYLFQGDGRTLRTLANDAAMELERGEDDLRLFSITSPKDLWYLTDNRSPLPGVREKPRQPVSSGMMGRIRHFFSAAEA